MEIHIDEELGVTPKGAETYTAAILPPQPLPDKTIPSRTGLSFVCPDCDEKAAVERGTKYDHNCDQPKGRRRLASVI